MSQARMAAPNCCGFAAAADQAALRVCGPVLGRGAAGFGFGAGFSEGLAGELHTSQGGGRCDVLLSLGRVGAFRGGVLTGHVHAPLLRPVNRAPESSWGTSSGTAAVMRTCSAVRDELGQAAPPLSVELGENVVEDQHRVVAVGAEQFEAGEPQRERERPGLAVAGVALGRQVAEPQHAGRRGAGRRG